MREHTKAVVVVGNAFSTKEREENAIKFKPDRGGVGGGGLKKD